MSLLPWSFQSLVRRILDGLPLAFRGLYALISLEELSGFSQFEVDEERWNVDKVLLKYYFPMSPNYQ